MIIARNNSNIALGDFSKDFFKEEVISNCLSELNFSQIASQSTHIRGRLLDRVYLKNDSVNSQFFSSLVKSFHYSEHETVFVLTDTINV